MDYYIDKSADVTDSKIENKAKVFKNCTVKSSLIGNASTVGDYSRVVESKVGNNVAIQRHSWLFNTVIGDYSYTGKNFTSWFCEIGRFCSISWNVSIGGANHDYTRTTTHAFLYSESFGLLDNRDFAYNRFDNKCIVGNDVWIGCNAVICRGVTIGNGAVVGAGSVVTHDVEPYSIVVGCPAKPIKKRFDDETIKLLIESEWWYYSKEKIKDNFELFSAHTNIDIAKKILALKDFENMED